MSFPDVNATASSQLPPNSSVFMLPNPFTPMAFLPPDIAVQVTVSNYIFIAMTTIQIWDTLTHLIDDYYLVTRNKIKFPMIVYFVSRISTLAFYIGTAIVQTAPLPNCALADQIVCVFFVISVPTSELLLFLHVRAVYINRKKVVYFFVLLWICALGSSTAAVISASLPSTRFRTIGPTKYCTGVGLAGYISASTIVPMINDTLLFLAMAWRLQHSSYPDENEKSEFTNIIFGRHLPRISRALFQNGQAYFLTTVIIHISTVAILYTASVPLAYRAEVGYVGVLTMNIMASRIYRNIRPGALRFDRQSTDSPSRSSGIKVNIHRAVDDIPLRPIRNGSDSSGEISFTNLNDSTKDGKTLNIADDRGV